MKAKTKQGAEGLILGIIGAILFLDFLAVDAQIFGYAPPQWIIRLSGYFQISGLMIDLISTIALLTLLAMLKTEREIGKFEK